MVTVKHFLCAWFCFTPFHIFSKDYHVGILQTASHPSLNATREGFEERLQEKLKTKKVHFNTKNGEGQISQIQTIAKSFKANSEIDLIFTIATPALQVMMKEEKTRPIVFTAVTAPENIGINPAATANIFGVTDKVNAKAQVEILTKMTPRIKKVGLLFNPSEQNSLAMIEELKQALTEDKINYIELGIHNTSDIVPSLNSAVKKVDLVLIPTDNTAASAMPLIAKKAKQLNLPLMISDTALLQEGVLLATGVDYKDSGRQAAEFAFKVLEEGKKPQTIGIQNPPEFKTVIHHKTMESLKITIPPEILKKSMMITEK